MVELLHAPPLVHLPYPPPTSDALGNNWYVDVRNLGPNDVTLEETAPSGNMSPQFTVLLHPKDVVRVRVAGSTYLVVKRY